VRNTYLQVGVIHGGQPISILTSGSEIHHDSIARDKVTRVQLGLL